MNNDFISHNNNKVINIGNNNAPINVYTTDYKLGKNKDQVNDSNTHNSVSINNIHHRKETENNKHFPKNIKRARIVVTTAILISGLILGVWVLSKSLINPQVLDSEEQIDIKPNVVVLHNANSFEGGISQSTSKKFQNDKVKILNRPASNPTKFTKPKKASGTKKTDYSTSLCSSYDKGC